MRHDYEIDKSENQEIEGVFTCQIHWLISVAHFDLNYLAVLSIMTVTLRICKRSTIFACKLALLQVLHEGSLPGECGLCMSWCG